MRQMTPRSRDSLGFTLVELLVVLGLVVLLLSLLVPALGLLRGQAKHVTERNSARQATIAWTNYAFENSGKLMPGYKAGLPASTPDGEPLSSQTIGVAANRYPWRLAPYLAHNFDVLYVNDQRPILDEMRGLPESDYLYLSATYPSIGLNTTWVGGDEVDGCFNPAMTDLFGQFYCQQLSRVQNPSRLMVFCSARGMNGVAGAGGEVVEGYFKVASPNFSSRRWAAEYDEDDPASAGNVSLRWGGQEAVVSRVDGGVDSLDITELEDMRNWADRATEPDWVLTPR